MEENLKKALSELLVLALLHERDYHAPELTAAITERSGGAISITFPYAILYRMIDGGYIEEKPKRVAPDGRRRQYYGVTQAGRAYFREIWRTYKTFTAGVDHLVNAVCTPEERGERPPEARTRHLPHRPLPPQGMSGRWPLRSRASDSSSPASTSTGRARPSAQIVRHAMGYPSLKKTAPK